MVISFFVILTYRQSAMVDIFGGYEVGRVKRTTAINRLRLTLQELAERPPDCIGKQVPIMPGTEDAIEALEKAAEAGSRTFFAISTLTGFLDDFVTTAPPEVANSRQKYHYHLRLTVVRREPATSS